MAVNIGYLQPQFVVARFTNSDNRQINQRQRAKAANPQPATATPRSNSNKRIIQVELGIGTRSSFAPNIEHERRVAIFDLLERNSFIPVSLSPVAGAEQANPSDTSKPPGKSAELPTYPGPFRILLEIQERSRLAIIVKAENSQPLGTVQLTLLPFRKIIKDYGEICASYYSAIKMLTPLQIETVDMARRAIHNEGSDQLRLALAEKIQVDVNTSRRLFTLLFVLLSRTSP